MKSHKAITLPYDISEYRELSEHYAKGHSIAAKTQRIQKELTSSDYIFIIITMGAELGLSPMQAINNIAIINGKLAIWGDGMLAVVRNSGKLELFKESFSKEKDETITAYTRKEMQEKFYTDDYKAVCRLKREGYDEQVYDFSVKDAKIASLWSFSSTKPSFSPWYKYPDRMLRMRARSWALRDNFTDYLNGLYAIEEAQDIQYSPEKEHKKKPEKIKKNVEVKPASFEELWEQKLKSKELSEDKKIEINKSLKDFIKLTAETHQKTEDKVKTSAVDHFDDFISSFGEWYKSKKTSI